MEYIEELMQLDDLLSSPIMDKELAEDETAALSLSSQLAYCYYANLISLRFPQADKELVARLGRANWERKNRIRTNLESEAAQKTETTPERGDEVQIEANRVTSESKKIASIENRCSPS